MNVSAPAVAGYSIMLVRDQTSANGEKRKAVTATRATLWVA